MTLPFMITFMTFWVGSKDMLSPSEVLGGAMAGLTLPWIRQCTQQHTYICRIVPLLKLSRRALPKEIAAKVGP